jgi:hypothetical protein
MNSLIIKLFKLIVWKIIKMILFLEAKFNLIIILMEIIIDKL